MDDIDMDIHDKVLSIKKCLESGEKLDEEKMMILFLVSFLQEEGKIDFRERRKQAD